MQHRFGMDSAGSPRAFVITVTVVVGYGPLLGIAAAWFGLARGGGFSVAARLPA
ncbi:MAG: hypothetical protein WAM29_13880 [Methylocella sp.]